MKTIPRWLLIIGNVCLIVVIVLIMGVTYLFTGASTNSSAKLDRTIANTKDGIVDSAISHDWKHLAIGTLNEGFQMWDIEASKMEYKLDPGRVQVVTFSPSNTQFAMVWESEDRTKHSTEIRQTSNGELIRTIGQNAQPNNLLFTSDGQKLIVEDFNYIIIFDANTGEIVRSMSTQGWGLGISPNDQYLAVGSDHIEIWDLPNNSLIKSMEGWNYTEFSPDSQLVAAPESGSGTNINLWESSTGTLIRTLKISNSSEGSQVHSLAFSPDGKTLVIGTNDQTVELMDITSGTHLGTLHLGQNTSSENLKFSSDGKTLAVQTFLDGVQFWQLSK